MEDKQSPPDILPEDDVMQALRELIVGPEKEKIVELEQHISEAAHPVATVEDVARSLPEAIRLRISQDKNLQRSLQPVMEQSIQESVLNNPKPLSEALFPIMGPAIRKSINHTLNSMLQSMNQALENSFSIQGLRWRWEAKKSDKSFAEVVMLHTLEYRVEQVFVIHRESGLLITHLAVDARMEEDADLVSSMLTAVRDFVRDSFAGDDKDEIDNLGMGELEVLIGQSPHVTLAVVCRGNIPQELYRMIDEHLEDVQKEYAHNLATFNGDTSLFVGIKDMLRDLMVADYKIKEERKRKPIRALMMIMAVVIPVLGWWGWSGYQKHLWGSYIQQLRQTAGVAVLHEGKEHGHFVVHGLLDPLAEEPLTLIPKHLPLKNIEMHWRPYYSLEDAIVLKRAIHLLKPVAETALRFESGTLVLRGAAHEPWIEAVAERALMVPGVLQTDIQLRNMDLEPLEDKVQRLLKPPASIQLTLNGTDLTAQGEALQAWQTSAQKAAKTITELSNYDDSAVIVVDSPAYLLAQAESLLQPPSSVQLSVDQNRVLFARGKVLSAWAQSAREAVTAIPYLASYNHRHLQLVDSPAYVQQQAYAQLKPPKSVVLSVSDALLLSARGEADKRWIQQARKQVKRVKYVQRYDDSGVIDPFDRDRVLRLAKKKLSPPSSVSLDYRGGRLYAGGRASTRWIERARKLAPSIRGVSIYDDRQLIDPAVLWANIQSELQSIHIAFQPGTGKIVSGIEQQKAQRVAQLFAKATKLIHNSRLQIVGMSSLYGERADYIAQQRAVTVRDLLRLQGVKPSAVIEKTQIVRDDRWGVAFNLLR